MEKSFVYFDKILHKLAGSYPRTCTLEELAVFAMPAYNVLKTFAENISDQRENKSKVLDALILLDSEGFIVLNPATEESALTVKGLIKINNIVFCN